MDDDASDRRKFVIFGRDLGEMPCFRNSFLYGIGTGIGVGLSYFLYSSKPKMSTHAGFGAFMMTTMGYWTVCRYNYSALKFEMSQLQRAMQDRALHEGTMHDAGVDGKINPGLDLKSA